MTTLVILLSFFHNKTNHKIAITFIKRKYIIIYRNYKKNNKNKKKIREKNEL